MQRLALGLVLLLGACGPKATTPAASTTTDPVGDGEGEGAPVADEPDDNNIDPACYGECMADIDDEGRCEEACSGEDDLDQQPDPFDVCMNDCMDQDGADDEACMAECEGE